MLSRCGSLKIVWLRGMNYLIYFVLRITLKISFPFKRVLSSNDQQETNKTSHKMVTEMVAELNYSLS